MDEYFSAPLGNEQRGEDLEETVGEDERGQRLLTSPSPQEEAEIQEWRASSHVSLPYSPITTSDGSVKPLTSEEEKLLREHISSGHLTKCNLCKGCLLSEGPRRMHTRVRDVDKGHTCPSHRHSWTSPLLT